MSKKNYLKTILRSDFFHGVKESECMDLLEHLDTQLKYYADQQYLIRAGQRTFRAGLVLSGSLNLEKEDFWNRGIPFFTVQEGNVFLLEHACSHTRCSYHVKSNETSVVLWFNVKSILKLDSSCTYNTVLIQNMMKTMASNNLYLLEKTAILSKDSTKEKILAYLSYMARITSSSSFDIPYDRKGLAEFLSVDRSAMSLQLSILQKEGWFHTKKNHFELLVHSV